MSSNLSSSPEFALVNTSQRNIPQGLLQSPAQISAAMAMLQSGTNVGNKQNLLSISSSNDSSTQHDSEIMPSSATSSSSTSAAGASTSQSLQPLARPTNGSRSNVAAFLTKLYNMVGETESNELIRWSDDGHSFIVIHHVEFAKQVLPRFFKHNNFSSFVRQLNMYGFHKVPHLQQGVLMPDTDNERWEFSNPHFQKNQPDLLCLVSRKKATSGNEEKDALTMDLGHIISEVTAIKKHQLTISADLKNIERDHQSLWQESLAARERHQRQQETIDKILRFLASVFSGDKKRAIVPNKKPRLTITEGDVEDSDDVDNEHSDSGDQETEISQLLNGNGNKRKRSSVTDANYSSPRSKQEPSFNITEMTPATLASLANNLTASSSSSSPNMSKAPNSLSSVPSASSSKRSSTTSLNVPGLGPIPDFTSQFNSTAYQPSRQDQTNLPIPTSLLPPTLNMGHHDMLRAMSMANANTAIPPPLPPLLGQTPAGANAIKDVDQVTRDIEELQRSIDHLKEIGLAGIDMTGYNFDDSYLSLANNYGKSYMDSLNGNGMQQQQDGQISDLADYTDQGDTDFITPALLNQHISSGPGSATASRSSPGSVTSGTFPSSAPTPVSIASTMSPSVGGGGTSTTSRTPTVGEEYLEDLLDMDPV